MRNGLCRPAARRKSQHQQAPDRGQDRAADDAQAHLYDLVDFLESKAADAFGPGGGSGAEQAAIDVKLLHAKIGELTLENDFLESALNKAGLLSAKR